MATIEVEDGDELGRRMMARQIARRAAARASTPCPCCERADCTAYDCARCDLCGAIDCKDPECAADAARRAEWVDDHVSDAMGGAT